MVSGCSTLVQFQAVHEIRALHYNQLKAALPSFKIFLSCRVFSRVSENSQLDKIHINEIISKRLKNNY